MTPSARSWPRTTASRPPLPTTPEGVQKRSADVLDELLGGVLGGGERPTQAPAKPDTSRNQTQRPAGANEEMLLDYLLKP